MLRGSLKLYIGLGAVVLALGGALYWSVSKLGEARSELRAAQVAQQELEGRLSALQERTARIQAQAGAAARKNEVFNQEIEDALGDDEDWSRRAVPVGIAERLCADLSCR